LYVLALLEEEVDAVGGEDGKRLRVAMSRKAPHQFVYPEGVGLEPA
jgi:hypothetical protein